MKTGQNIIEFLRGKYFLLPYFIFIIVGVILYKKTLTFEYVWDDNYFLFDNTLLKEKEWSWNTFLRPIIEGTSYFRPLIMVSWMAEAELFSLQPAVSHGINLFLYVINCCILYKIACLVFKKYEKQGKLNGQAICATLLYAVHPCLVESVAWVSGRFDLLATTFTLAASLVAISPFNIKRGVLFGIFSLAALLSKEIGILIPCIVFSLTFAISPSEKFKFFYRGLGFYLLIFIAAALFYFFLRSLSLDVVAYHDFKINDIFERIISGLWIRHLSFYSFISLFPFMDLMSQHVWENELNSWRQSNAALIASVCWFGAVCFFAFKRKPWAILWMGFFVSISLVLGIVTIHIGGTVGSERFLCFPLAMLSLSIVEIYNIVEAKLKNIKRKKELMQIFFSGWICLLFFYNYNYQIVWKSNIFLWGFQYEKSPNNATAIISYLMALSDDPTSLNREKFMEIIEKVREDFEGRFPREVQIIYANYLLNQKDPEALPYYEGVVNMQIKNIDEIRHVENKFNTRLDFYSRNNYLKSLIAFGEDMDKTRMQMEEFNMDSMVERGFEAKFVSTKIVIYYLSGDVERALEVYKENLPSITANGLENTARDMAGMVNEHCKFRKEKNEWDKEDCFEYTENFLGHFFKPGELKKRHG